MQMLQHIQNICYHFYWWNLLLLFRFLSNQENQYMIHHDLNLFYDTYHTITEYNQRQTHYLSVIPNYYFFVFKWMIKLFYNFICFIINHNFYVMTFWIHYLLFIIIEEIRLLVLEYVRFFEIIYNGFLIWTNFIKIFLNWYCFISITVSFIFNIIVTPNIAYS